MGNRRHLLASALCTSVVAAVAALCPGPALAAAGCTKYASPTGSDSADGSQQAPLQSAQALANSLSPGETGCLRAGDYQGVDIRHGGRAGAPITLRSYPGERANVNGRFWVTEAAPFVVVEDLYLDGKNPTDHPSPTINASDVTFRHNDVTNDHSSICFLLGDSNGTWGRADRAVIESNRIHDCGELPATNFHHGIYLEAASGARIEGNWIYANADYGVHLYPDADHTLVRGNVIEANGKGITISGDGGMASDSNQVEGNVIADSSDRFNVEAWWPQGNPVPQDNAVTRNCLKAGRVDWYHNGGVDMQVSQAFSLSANLIADPGFANGASNDFRLSATSACRAVFEGDPLAVPGPDAVTSDPAPAPAPAPAPQPEQPATPAPAPAPQPRLEPLPTERPAHLTPGPEANAPLSHPHRFVRRASRRRRRGVSLTIAPTASAVPSLRRSSTVRLLGRVTDTKVRSVRIQLAVGKGWRTVAATPVRRGRFSTRWCLTAPKGSRRIVLRAVTRQAGSSAPVPIELVD